MTSAVSATGSTTELTAGLVPNAPPMPERLIETLADLTCRGSVVALTGAGCSTESGIPDYRDPLNAGRPHRPITYSEFVGSAEARRRYWARSLMGWRRIRSAQPNAAHRALCTFEQEGALLGIITQNVDGLHGAAGNRHVIELHGSLDRVGCLDCRTTCNRDEIQTRLEQLNPGWRRDVDRVRPDGDFEVPEDAVRSFLVAACVRCDGVLKPEVVFFGEGVPRHVVSAAYHLVDRAASLWVIGSSLTVYSGFRFVRHAAADRTVVIVNVGPTRADSLARVRINGRCGEVLTQLLQRLN